MTEQDMNRIITEVEHALAVENMQMTLDEKENLRRVGRNEISFDELIAQYVTNAHELAASHAGSNRQAIRLSLRRFSRLVCVREGNGRTQRIFANQLANNAGWNLNLTSIDPDTLCKAYISAMADCTELETLLDKSMTCLGDLKPIYPTKHETKMKTAKALEKMIEKSHQSVLRGEA